MEKQSVINETVSDVPVAGTLFSPQGKDINAGILLIRGWGDSHPRRYLKITRMLIKEGYTCFILRLRGQGVKEELFSDISPAQSLEDVVAGYDFLSTRLNETAPISAIAFSYGGYLATILTLRRRLDWMVLRSPALYPDEYFTIPKSSMDRKKLMAFRQRNKIPPDKNKALSIATRYRGNLLIVGSERDTVVPARQLQNYLDAFRQSPSDVTFKIIPEADHSLSQKKWKDEFRKIVQDWLYQMQKNKKVRLGEG